MSFGTIGIARPELLALLLIAPLLVALVVLAERARARSARAFAGAAGLSARSRVRLIAKSTLLLLAFAAVVIALAGPFVDLRLRGARRLGVDIVLAVDVSQSMATRDVEPDRLRAARHVSQELGERMVGSRVSLVLFAGQGATRYPATTDPRILGEVLDNSGKSGNVLQKGSSLAAAIDAALQAFPLDPSQDRGRAIVVVSDGEVTLGSAPDVASLADKNIKLFTLGVGTTKGGQIPTYDANDGKFTGYLRGADGVAIVSKLDEKSLADLAAAGGGRYWHFEGNDAVLGELAGQLHTLEAVEPVENAGSVPDERSRPFIAFAVMAVVLERLISDRRKMPTPGTASRAARKRGRRLLGLAIGSAVLWSIACGPAGATLEDANARFARGDYQRALADYRDMQVTAPNSPQLSINAGNALYMLSDYSRALPDYAKAIDVAGPDIRAIAQYDRGNALYRLGRLEDARDAYKEALRLEPTDRDAKFNLELIQRLLDARLTPRGNPQPGQSGSPNASGQPGGQGTSGSSGAASSPEPGNQPGTPTDQQTDPTSDRAPGDTNPSDLRGALSDFRVGLTLDDALRVLDALQGQQRGIAQLIEGQRRGTGPNPEY
jgi:Ca-activated chloride channel family protein